MRWEGVDWSNLTHVGTSCGPLCSCNEPSCSIEYGTFLGQLRKRFFFKNDCSVVSVLKILSLNTERTNMPTYQADRESYDVLIQI